MDYKIIDDCIHKDDLKTLTDTLCNYSLDKRTDFPWFYSESIASKHETSNAGVYFYHPFYASFNWCSDWSFLLEPILQILQPKAIIRIKGNLYPATENIIEHSPHTDYNYSHKGAVFFLNSNNGSTVLSDRTRISSISNRLLLFDPSCPHQSTNCTDKKSRISINFNYY